MSRQEEQQIINDAPVILETILSEYGEVNAIAEVQRLVNIAKSAIQRAEAAEAALQLFRADERDLQEAHYEIETLRAAVADATAKRAKEDAIHDAKIGDRLKIYLAAATARAEAAERKSEDLIIVATHVSDYAGWLQKDLADANARIAELDAKLDAVRSIVATAAGIESLDNAAVEVKVQP